MSESSRGGARPGGWSLPLTWIAVVTAVVVAIVFGRSALAAVVAGMAGAALSLYVYRRLTARTDDFGAGHRVLVFRFESVLPLARLEEPLLEALGATTLQRDFENVWEWVRGESDDGTLRFNLSRRHWAAVPGVREMVHGRIECVGRGPMTTCEQRVGTALARCLHRKITFGRIDRRGDAGFEAAAVFRPPVARPDLDSPDRRIAMPCEQCGRGDVGTIVVGDMVQQQCRGCGAVGARVGFLEVSDRLVGAYEAVSIDEQLRPIETLARGAARDVADAVVAATSRGGRVWLRPV